MEIVVLHVVVHIGIEMLQKTAFWGEPDKEMKW